MRSTHYFSKSTYVFMAGGLKSLEDLQIVRFLAMMGRNLNLAW